MNRELQEPWAVPPHPTHGDPDSIMTYAAKGRAVCAWERLESALSYLFAILIGKDWGDDEAADIYGAAGNFHERFRRLREAKDRFFIPHHCQRLEGDLDELLRRVEGFQPRRNEITHSTIVYRPDQNKGLNIFCYRRTSRRKNSMQTHGPVSFTRLWLLRSLPTTFRH
jgi:hypothetical protein